MAIFFTLFYSHFSYNSCSVITEFVFQENVNIAPPKWATDVMPQIKEMTKIEYTVQTYSSELLRLAAGKFDTHSIMIRINFINIIYSLIAH